MGIFKMCMRKDIGKQTLKTQFHTLITEIEAIINTRPLAFGESSVDDSFIIRPIDFLMPCAQLHICPKQDSEEQTKEENVSTVTPKQKAILNSGQIASISKRCVLSGRTATYWNSAITTPVALDKQALQEKRLETVKYSLRWTTEVIAGRGR